MPAPRSRGGGGAMRAKEMHPLCCISIDCPAVAGDDRSPSPTDRNLDNAGSDGAVAGVLHKWTNFGKGWRSRWFELRNGVLSYSKVRVGDGDVRLIGDPRWHRTDGRRNRRKPAGVVHLKVSSFRESRSDDRRFYIFSTTKTLHLRTDSRKDRVAWIKALLSARCTIPLRSVSDQISFIHNDASISTENLRNRLLEEGINESLIKDCEQIMLSEFSQVKQLCEERFGVLAFQQLEEHNVDPETVGIQGAPLLLKNGFSSSGHGKYSEYSTTESSDDIEKQELDESSEEDEPAYFDTNECFTEPTTQNNLVESIVHASDSANTGSHMRNHEEVHRDTILSKLTFSCVERRKRLPTPVEKEKSTSLWSIIKDNVGKDLTRVCLPVYFNEPISSLQKCFEDLEYSQLLDRAYEYGKMGNSLMRALYVAAFAVSGYASSDGRPCKPFNPLLGETYEADYPEKGVRFFSEKVSHHPMLIACHCEGGGWKFWGDSNLRSKFWGRSIQLDPVGILTLEFDDGEVFRWSKVTTSIYNLILGKVYCDHHGTMSIQGNREYSCKLRFKEQSLLDRNPRQVQGFVEASCGTKAASIFGKWDDSLYYTVDGDASRKSADIAKDASLLWKRNETPAGLTRYNLTSFAITLNEMTPELQDKLPPTDSRRRPDQRHLENGEFEKANAEKQRLENRQRMSRKLQEDGWKPRWFQKDGEDGTYRYLGGYWETRERNKWEGCPNIFGDFAEASVPLK